MEVVTRDTSTSGRVELGASAVKVGATAQLLMGAVGRATVGSQRFLRLRALEQLGEMADQGEFDEFLGNKDAYRR